MRGDLSLPPSPPPLPPPPPPPALQLIPQQLCATSTGSTIYVLSAPAPAGPWTFQGDVGSVPGHTFDKHSPDNYVSKAQGSAIFKVDDQVVYLGNQWNSGLKETPPGPRNHDLLFWTVLQFDDGGRVEQVVWEDEVEVVL